MTSLHKMHYFPVMRNTNVPFGKKHKTPSNTQSRCNQQHQLILLASCMRIIKMVLRQSEMGSGFSLTLTISNQKQLC